MYRKNTHIHFIGIGGIGMSGIAQVLRKKGYTISGCDSNVEQQSVRDLDAIGCSVAHGNNSDLCNDTTIDIVVYSSAIHTDNPELQAARNRSIPTVHRSHMLAEIMRPLFSIGVTGSHGKTTTSALISHILLSAKKDPTIVVGGYLENIQSNAHAGSGELCVVEADESDRSLLNLHPWCAIVTNVDLDHLETYRDLEDVQNTFKQFVDALPFYGFAVICADDIQSKSLFASSEKTIISYGIEQPADFYATDIQLTRDQVRCVVHKKENAAPLGMLTLNMAGKHNLLNALGATALCMMLDIPFNTIQDALATFTGIDRRFTFKGTYRGALVYDDYGHHPEEIRNTLLVAREKTKNKLTVLFQPHRYTRTQFLWNEFIDMFAHSNIDRLIITDIYPASESPIEGIDSKTFLTALKQKNPSLNLIYAPLDTDFLALKHALDLSVDEGDLVLLQGAGKINQMASALCK